MCASSSRAAGRRLWRAFGLAAAMLACAAASLAQNIPGVAARVNGAEISNFRLERHFEAYLKTQRRNISSMINPRVYKKLKREALDQLIEHELLWQAAKSEGAVAPDDEVQAAMRTIEAQMKTRDSYLRAIEQAGFDEKSHAEHVRRELSGLQHLVRKSSSPPPVTDDEVAAYYEQYRHRFEQAPATQPLDELREAIRTRLLAEKKTALAREVIAGLKAAARIELLVQLD
jgi:hypothetical protein